MKKWYSCSCCGCDALYVVFNFWVDVVSRTRAAASWVILLQTKEDLLVSLANSRPRGRPRVNLVPRVTILLTRTYIERRHLYYILLKAGPRVVVVGPLVLLVFPLPLDTYLLFLCLTFPPTSISTTTPTECPFAKTRQIEFLLSKRSHPDQ